MSDKAIDNIIELIDETLEHTNNAASSMSVVEEIAKYSGHFDAEGLNKLAEISTALEFISEKVEELYEVITEADESKIYYT